MLGGWSTTIDPIQLAGKGARLTGELPLRGLRRLIEVCGNAQGAVEVDLQFERDPAGGLHVMHGRLTARVGMTCQRCMERFAVDLHSEPRVTLLRPGEREDLLESGDAVVVERPVTLGQLVEDELLLEVPMVPMHPADLCPARASVAAKVEEQEAARPNPFSVLERLKRTDR